MSDNRNKIVMLGDSGVGKTALVAQWVHGKYEDGQRPTIGAAYSKATIVLDGEEHKVQIWDTAGEEKYRSMAPIYAQGASGALIVFDVTNKHSFDHITDWVKCLETNGEIPIVVAGNKCDLDGKQELDMDEVMGVMSELGYEYYETSAKTGKSVEEAFQALIQKAVKARDTIGASYVSLDVAPRFENPSEDSGCC